MLAGLSHLVGTELFLMGYGRAEVVDEFGEEPTSTIRLDAVLFTRLAGGRTTAEENADAIDLGGDTEVGRRIVENLAFVR